ncbi:MAG: glycine C-acetyltransferase, partial [Sphingomonadales bacterium]|nr:glycine C-acetyltransferase [Sphingomonadales bacterium]
MRNATSTFLGRIEDELQGIRDEQLFKTERVITSKQYSEIDVMQDGTSHHVLNFCANNYLGLANSDELVKAGQKALEDHGYGMASVRFICGTQDVHTRLEKALSDFLDMDDTILYAAAFDANGGVFEPLLGAEDAIISDALNHASIIDGVRLCKAMRFRYANSDMAALEQCLKDADAKGARTKMIVTDGVFSMDGYIAKLPEICDLADKYGALVMVDDSHAHGFMGQHGRGTPEHCGVEGRIDIITGTLGKALGGGMGGFTSAKKPVIDMLRQRSRPYLFSNTLAPAIVATSLKVLEMLFDSTEFRDKLMDNTSYFRQQISSLGLDVIPGEHPIV